MGRFDIPESNSTWRSKGINKDGKREVDTPKEGYSPIHAPVFQLLGTEHNILPRK